MTGNALCSPAASSYLTHFRAGEDLGSEGRGDTHHLHMLCPLKQLDPNIYCPYGQLAIGLTFTFTWIKFHISNINDVLLFEFSPFSENLKSNVSSSEDTARGMSADLNDLRKKLSSTEKSSKSAVNRAKKLKDVIGTSQKALDEVMLKFNEVLEEEDDK